MRSEVEPRSSGKERDTETGLDYFGARYYGNSTGRFTSPDPLLNSGRPWDPQTWNRYSYARNNPLVRIDPDGLYDFDKVCGRTDTKCQADQKRFNDAIDNAAALLKTLPKDSAAARAIKKSLDTLGTKGDKNGVKIGFGATATGGTMEKDGNHITVDWSAVDAGVQRYKAAGFNIDPSIEDAAEAVHEGSHLSQLTLTRRIANKWDIMTVFEREAYGAQSYLSESGKSESVVWNQSWAESADKETLRQSAVREAAKGSVDASRREYEGRGKK